MNITLRETITFSLCIALSIAVGLAVVAMPGLSAGAWMKNLAPAAFLGALLVLHQMEALPTKSDDWASLLKLPEKGGVSLKSVLASISIGVAAAVALIHYGFGLTITLTFLLTGFGILISTVLIVSNRGVAGLSVLIVTLPMVHFLEYQFRVFHKAYHGVFFTMPSLIILWIIAFMFLLVHLSRRNSFVGSPFNLVWLIILIPMLLSATFSIDQVVGFRNVFYFVSISIPFFLVFNIIRTEEDLKLCTTALAVAAGMRVLTMLYFELGKASAGFAYNSLSHTSLPSYTSILGMGVALCFFLSLGLVLNERGRLKKVLVVGAVTLLLVVTSLKLPRSIVIALFLGLLVMLSLRNTRKWILVGLFVSTLAVFSSWDYIKEHTAMGRFEQFSSVESFESNQRMRLDAYQTSFAIIKDNPIFGIGPEMWDEYYFKYMSDPTVWIINGIPTVQYVRGAHNIFLQQGVTCGIPGLVGVMALAFLIFQQLIVTLRNKCSGVSKDLTVSFAASMVVFWVTWTIGGGHFEIEYSPEQGYWFWLLVGLIAASKNLNSKRVVNGGKCEI